MCFSPASWTLHVLPVTDFFLNENLPKITSSNISYFFFHFMTPSESYLCSVERWDYRWVVHCNGSGRKRYLPNSSTIPECFWRGWGKQWNISLRVDGVLASIRTEHFPNTNLERYSYGEVLVHFSYNTLAVQKLYILGNCFVAHIAWHVCERGS
jgi:hypothetical protein